MLNFLGQAGFTHAPGQLQLAAGIGGDENVGPGLFNVVQFTLKHLLTFLRKLQAPGRSTATAPAGFLHFSQLYAGNLAQQFTRLA